MSSFGYLSQEYAESFAYIGTPRYLPACGGWIVERQIPGTSELDAMGCYPLFLCRDWSKLPDDLSAVKSKFVSLSLVTDPFGKYDREQLEQVFPDCFFPFKQHFIIDLKDSPLSNISKHHQRNAKKALKLLTIEQCQNPKKYLYDWINLYQQLIKKHDISGITTFSEKSFNKQFEVPGIVVFRALFKGTLVGMLIWYVHEDRAYYHLGAYNDLGYEFMASFGLFWHSIEYFQNRVSWLGLGSGAGLKGNGTDGLTRFKSGWSTQNKPAYFCGKILNLNLYNKLTKEKNTQPTNYFPAYRNSGIMI